MTEAFGEELSRLISGEVFVDQLTREAYATAACIYRIVPLAVVRPRNAGEVAAVVSYAVNRGIPVTARGAGTAVAGQSLGRGIIIDFAAHMDQVLSVKAEKKTVRVEPGVVLGDLNRALAHLGLVFPPDPSSGDYATIGGMIANNSSGPHSLKYGDTRRWIRKLKVVFADGSAAWMEPQVLPAAGLEGTMRRVYNEIPPLLDKYKDRIDRSRLKVDKNSAGYHVWDLVENDIFNPVPLVAGSEGTLAVVVEAELALAELPPAKGVGLFAFESMEDAANVAETLKSLRPSAIEIMDHLFIQTVWEHRADLRQILPPSARAVLLVEMEAKGPEHAFDGMKLVAQLAAEKAAGKITARIARSRDEADELWSIRKAASPILYRLPGKRLTRFVEDVVVPPGKLAEAIGRIQEILREFGTEAPVLGHAGSGNLHLNPRLDLTDPAERRKMAEIADRIYTTVIAMGGSITGEHGDGILRAPFLPRQFPELMPLFREIKNVFDPFGALNPGKILTDQTSLPTEDLRYQSPDGLRLPSLSQPELAELMQKCHGCGLCRTYCPVYAATNLEIALPRAKVSILRAVAAGQNPEISNNDLDRVFSMCTTCQRCLSMCPTGIETAAIIRAAKNDTLEAGRRPLIDRALALTPQALAAASLAPGAANAIVRSVPFSVLASMAGIKKDAPLPTFTADSIKEAAVIAKKEPNIEDGPTRKVILFPGCIGRYADSENETMAALDILRRLGFQVLLPRLPCCGEAKLLLADLKGAEKDAARFARALGKLPGELPIITTCHTCAITMKHDYPRLLGEKGEKIAGRAREIFEFIDTPGLRDLTRKPITMNALYHRSCHHVALGKTDHVLSALQNIPELELHPIPDSCCGLAGFYGLKEQNRAVSESMADAITHSARSTRITKVVSACPACRLQIEALGLAPVSAISLVKKAVCD